MLELDEITATAGRFDTPTEKLTDPVPVLYQSGYLTIKGYNRRSKVFKLGFPNTEVKKRNYVPIKQIVDDTNIISPK